MRWFEVISSKKQNNNLEKHIFFFLAISLFVFFVAGFVSAASSIDLSMIFPTGNVNVSQFNFFNVTSQVCCVGDNCGDINVSLDPIGTTCDIENNACDNTCSPIFDSTWYSTQGSPSFSFNELGDGWCSANIASADCKASSGGGSFITAKDSDCDSYLAAGTGDCAVWFDTNGEEYFCPSYARKGSAVTSSDCAWVDCMTGSQSYTFASLFDLTSSFFAGASSGSGKGLVNTTTGATPFYTIDANPNITNLDAGVCKNITWRVNATGNLGTTYTFFTFANLTSDMSISNITSFWNVTIKDLVFPLINFTSPTPAHKSTIEERSFIVNVSINESNLKTLTYRFNNTNYDLYDDSLVLMMNFDNVSALGDNETFAKDLSKNNSFSTIYGAIWNVSGKYNGALTFDGSDDYVEVNNLFLDGNKPRTVSLWIYPAVDESSTPDWASPITIGGEGESDKQSFVITVDNSAECGTNHAIGGHYWSFNTCTDKRLSDIGINQWHHLVLTHNGSAQSFYIDGKLEGTSSYTDLNTASGTTYLGKRRNGNVEYQGGIDEVRVFNRSLSASEVYQLYASNLNKKSSADWSLYVNQSQNATTGLANGSYAYKTTVVDASNNINQTETRIIRIFQGFSSEVEVPQINFTSPTPANNTITTNTSFIVNVSITNASDLKNLTYNFNNTNYVLYDDSLVLMMNFDNVSALGDNETFAKDLSKYGNDASLLEGASYGSGKYGKGIAFDGSDDYIKLADNGNGKFSYQNITVSMWVYTPASWDSDSDYYPLFSYDYTSHDSPYYARQLRFTIGNGGGAGKLMWAWNDGSNYHEIQATSASPNSAWLNIVAVYQSGRQEIWQNGVIIASDTRTDTVSFYNQPVWIGKANFATTKAITIDEVKVYNRSLSSQEIYQGYVSNLAKIDANSWNLYVNQSKNATAGLDNGTYTYQLFTTDIWDNINSTELRTIRIGESEVSDTNYPIFSDYQDNNGTLTDSGIAVFNVTVENTNGTVYLNINNSIILATNLTSNVYNVSLTLTNGTYLYNWSAYGNGTSNLLNNSDNRYYTVLASVADTTKPYFIDSTPENQTINYFQALNYDINATDETGFSCFAVNDSRFKINCSGLLQNNSVLAVGTYNLNITINDTSNNLNSTVMSVSVNRIASQTSLIFDKTSPQTYGNQINASCSRLVGEGNVVLYRNGVDVTSSENSKNILLGANTYSYECNLSETQNYTASTNSSSFVVNQNSSYVLGISGTTPITYGTATDVAGSNCPAELTCSLDKTNEVYGAGTITFNYSTVGNANYSANSITTDIVINQASQTAVLSINETSPIVYGTLINVTCNGELYRNDVNVTTQKSQSILLGAGSYDYSCKLYGNENYTYDDDNSTFVVNKASGNINLLLNNTSSNITITTSSQVNASAASSTQEIQLLRNGTDVTVQNNVFQSLDVGSYNYTAIAISNQNYSEARITRFVEVVAEPDSVYPTFTSYYDNNATLNNSGIAVFNVTVENTNGTVYLNINNSRILATNLTSNVYNVSLTLTNGTYLYNWSAYGNGTSNLLNNSDNRYYTVLTVYYSAVNLTSPLNNSEVIRGGISTAEDDIGIVDNYVTIFGKVYDNSSLNGIENANCSFYSNNSFIGSNLTNSSGLCILSYDKSSLSSGIYELKINYTRENYTSVISESKANINLTIVTIPNFVDNIRAGNQYMLGDVAVLRFNITKNNNLYDPDSIVVNATKSDTTVITTLNYPGAIVRESTGKYYALTSINSSFGNFIRWNIIANSGSQTIASAIEADKDVIDSTGKINVSMFNISGSNIAFNYTLYDRNNYLLENRTIITSYSRDAASGDNYTKLDINSENLTLNMFNLNFSGNISIVPYLVYYSGDMPLGVTRLSQVVALNQSGFNFTKTSIKVNKNGISPDRICYCSSWNFSSSLCLASWICNSSSVYESYTSGDFLYFNVTHFTAYAGGIGYSSNLTIYDSNDSLGGNNLVYSLEQAKFYANYTNSSSGSVITGAVCNFSENSTGSWSSEVLMSFNSTSNLYEYNLSFSNSGIFSYNISCYGNASFDSLSAIDTIPVLDYVDTTSPSVNLISPSNDTSTTNTSIIFSCNATDNMKLANLTLYVWNSSGNINYTNTSQVSGTFNSSSWNIYLAVGNYSWNCLAYDNSSNLNWSNNYSLRISSDTVYPIFTSYYDNNATLNNSGIAVFNVTVENTNGTVYLNINNSRILATNLTSNVYNVSLTLTNGTYLYNWSAYGNGTSNLLNNSDNRYYTVLTTDVTPPYFTYVPENATLNYSQALLKDFNATDDINLSCFAVNDSRFKINCDGLLENNSVLAVGNYNLNITINDTTNNLNSTLYFVNVTQIIPTLTLSSSNNWNVSYGIGTNITGECNSQLTCLLYKDNLLVDNSQIWNLSQGTYNFTYNTTGNVNYSSYSVSYLLSVNSTYSLVYAYINNSRTNFTATNNSALNVNLSGQLVSGTGNIELWLNGTIINNGTSPLFNITNLSVGNYNFSVIYRGNTNYSSSSETFWISVREFDVNAPVVNLTSPADSYTSTSLSVTFSYNVSDENELNNCSLVINNNITAYNSTYVNKSLTNSIAYTFAGNGNYNWSVNCTDIEGNTGNSSTRNIIISYTASSCGDGTCSSSESCSSCSADCGSCSTSSSGGGLRFYNAENKSLEQGYTNVFLSGTGIKINVANDTHHIFVLNIINNSLQIKVKSRLQEAVIIPGQTKSFDVNEDNKQDLSIKLNSINTSAKSVNLTIYSINPALISTYQETENKQVARETENKDLGLEYEPVPIQEDKANSRGIIFILTVILIVAFVLIILKIRKNRVLRGF